MANLFITPSKIYTGEQALKLAIESSQTLGNKALIVTDDTMVKLNNVKELTNLLDEHHIQYAVFSEVNQEPTDTIVEKGAALYKSEACDFLIALGGGSPIDTMKAIAILVNSNKPFQEVLNSPIITRPLMIAIPTTAGTGSEATQFTIITNTKENIKSLISNSLLIPDIAIIDPQFTMSVPKAITAATGLDALCHAIESYISKKAQPMSKVFSLSATKRILSNLETCYDNGSDVEARNQMAIASLEAGIAFNNASVTLIHGMSRPIGALFHVAHGLSNAMLLNVCLTYIFDKHIDEFAEIAVYCNIANEQDSKVNAAQSLLNKIFDLLDHLEIPNLKEYGINETDFNNVITKMSKDAVDSGSPSNIKFEITQEDIIDLYNKLF